MCLPEGRAEGLLALLAVAGDLGCRRDRIVALLWSERDAAHARHNLRDILHEIRAVLGADAVPGSGNVLLLHPAHIESDVQEFGTALATGRLADAVAVYRGPFLDGFHLREAPEFERWVDDERGRLCHDCLGAAKRLAKEAENERLWDAAAEWWARAITLDRYNTQLVVRRMVALARRGDPVNAIKEGETHCRLLKSDLDLEPDPSFLEELQRIRSGQVGPACYFTPPLGSRHRGGSGP